MRLVCQLWRALRPVRVFVAGTIALGRWAQRERSRLRRARHRPGQCGDGE